MDDKPPKRSAAAPSTRFRRRRFIWCTLILFALACFCVPWELPSALTDSGVVPTGLSRANIVSFVNPSKGNEIYGLLHFMISRKDEVLVSSPTALDPNKPIAMSVYGGKREDWKKTEKALNQEYPVVVFSKTYCPFSKKAKELLALYDLSPVPKIIEVDLRDDGDLIKLILKRLTNHSTFPNVLLQGASIGGSDTIQELHTQKKLKGMFEKAGVKVKGSVPSED